MSFSWTKSLATLALLGMIFACTSFASAQFPFGGRSSVRGVTPRRTAVPRAGTFRGLSGPGSVPRSQPGKDAKPSDWHKYINDDKVTPPIQPKGRLMPQYRGPGVLVGPGSVPRAQPGKDAKPSDWHRYVNDDKVTPPIQPKGRLMPQYRGSGVLVGPGGVPRAQPGKDAKPSDWHKYINNDKVTPPIQPKDNSRSYLPDHPRSPYRTLRPPVPTKQGSSRSADFFDSTLFRKPEKIGFPPPTQRSTKTPPTFPRDLRDITGDIQAPYVHPPRDGKPPKFPN